MCKEIFDRDNWFAQRVREIADELFQIQPGMSQSYDKDRLLFVDVAYADEDGNMRKVSFPCAREMTG